MKPEEIKQNIAHGTLTAKQHTWETAKRYGLDEGIRNIVDKFGKPDVLQVIHDNGQTMARWQR